ncbi:MAG: hypothetical protein AAF291_09280 [Pseudomonadota bacterium]
MRRLVNYFSNREKREESLAKAAILLPTRAYQELTKPPHIPGNVITGRALHQIPLLASYSRSGTNWIRYFIETCSKRPTPGQLRVVKGTHYIIDRAHCAYPDMHNYCRVVLVLRNYKECLLRHNEKEWVKDRDVVRFLQRQDIEQPCSWFIDNLAAFDAFEGEKLLLYYEDLMQDPMESFTKLGHILRLKEARVAKFGAHLDAHFDGSVNAYKKGGHKSSTAKKRDLKAHADRLLTPEQRVEFDRYYQDNYPELTRKYLTRYLEA